MKVEPSSSSQYKISDLTIWRTKIPGVRFALLPPSNSRPNPRVWRDYLFVSAFSPGAVFAYERKTGGLIWKKKVRPFAHSSVYVADGLLYVGSSHTLSALEPETGRELWSFSPHGNTGEWIYSSPTVSNGRLFIGDRCGNVHCLNSKSGETIWRQKTNRSKNGGVNCTPLVIGRTVYVSTNARTLLAYGVESGSLKWKSRIDGPSVLELQELSTGVVAGAKSLFIFKKSNGSLVQRHWFPRSSITALDRAARGLMAITRSSRPEEPMSSRLWVANRSGEWRDFVVEAACLLVRYEESTNLVYGSHLHGILLIDPLTGAPTRSIRMDQRPCDGFGLVDVSGDKIYALTGKGELYALRHPYSHRGQ